eukprot:gene8355-895_t
MSHLKLLALSMEAPKLFRAIADFQSDDPEDLSFKAGQTIVVTDQGQGRESWWEGEINGETGAFPGTYVEPLSKFVSQMAIQGVTSDDDHPANDNKTQTHLEVKEIEDLSRHATPALRTADKSVVFKNRSVSFDLDNTTVRETYSNTEYDRSGDFNPDISHQEWIKEEAAEKLRMLEDRWSVLETTLPPGKECEERIAYNKKLEEEEKQKKEQEETRLRIRREMKLKLQQRRQKRDEENISAVSGPISADGPPSKPSRAERLRRLQEARAQKQKMPLHEANVAEYEEEHRERDAFDVCASSEDATSDKIGQFTIVRGSALASTSTIDNADSEEAMSTSQQGTGTEYTSEERLKCSEMTPLDAAIAKLNDEINSLSQKDDDGITGFERGFMQLDREDRKMFRQRKTSAGSARPELNRYTDIIPYDATRVVLGTSSTSEDYINASHIRGLLPGAPHYIAAQGPLPASVPHFWKMVAQERVRVIVMVTGLVESSKSKCEKYWPDRGQVLAFENSTQGLAVKVFCEEEEQCPSWTKRTFTVTQPQNEELVSLVVTQFHFTSWPDRGVPDNPVVFLSFIHAVMGAQNDAQLVSRNESEEHLPPMIIHCSAGVGRSGVFILVYSMLTYLPYVSKGGRHILNIFETIQRMRKYRRYFVQTLDQYQFCYHTILHAAKFYRDGSNRLKRQREASGDLQQKSLSLKEDPSFNNSSDGYQFQINSANDDCIEPAKTKVHNRLTSTKAWFYPTFSGDNAEQLLLRMQPAQDGLFLVHQQDQPKSSALAIAFILDGTVHHCNIIQDDLGFLSVTSNGWPNATNLDGLIHKLSQPEALSNFPVQLNPVFSIEVAPPLCPPDTYANSPESTSNDTLKASNLMSRETASASPSPITVELSHDSENSLRKKSTLRSRMKSFTKKLAPRKVKITDELPLCSMLSSLSLPTFGNADQDKELIRDTSELQRLMRMAQFSPPDPKILNSPFKSDGDTFELTSRSVLLSFLNGVYNEVSRQHRGNAVYKRREPIHAPNTLMHGEYSFLFMDIDDRAWVFFLPNAGPVACSQSFSNDPVATVGEWLLVTSRKELVVEDFLHFQRLESLPDQLKVRRRTGNEDIAAFRSEIESLRSRLREATEREHLATQIIQSQKTVLQEQLVQSQEREKALALRLLDLQEMVATKLGMKSLDQLQETAAATSTSGNFNIDESATLEQNLRLQHDAHESNTVYISSSNNNAQHTQSGRMLTLDKSLDLSNIESRHGLGSDEEDTAAIEDAKLIEARRQASTVADLFEMECASTQQESTRRGLPDGALWDEIDELDLINESSDKNKTTHNNYLSQVQDEEDDDADDDDVTICGDEIVPFPKPREYIALRDFHATKPDELSFSKGQTITVQARQGHLFLGELFGNKGRFDMSLVEKRSRILDKILCIHHHLTSTVPLDLQFSITQ